jgi:toxin YoeB
MVKKIIWTENALKDRHKIYKFWTEHNKSETYSEKLDLLIEQKIDLLASFPNIGLNTDYKEINITTVSTFSIFYKLNANSIFILRIFDSRRNPNKIKPL